jgi:hypothetical protein
MRERSKRDLMAILFPGAVIFLLFICLQSQSPALASERWSGVDETVVEKYAKEHGREGRSPLINTDQGDLLLFVFLVAGCVGGFVAGYYWRVLTEQRSSVRKDGAGVS